MSDELMIEKTQDKQLFQITELSDIRRSSDKISRSKKSQSNYQTLSK